MTRTLSRRTLIAAAATLPGASLLHAQHHGQNEAWDSVADRWESHAPMLTPRHGMGAVVLGDSIYVAGGGPQMGGGVKSAIHEAFTLG